MDETLWFVLIGMAAGVVVALGMAKQRAKQRASTKTLLTPQSDHHAIKRAEERLREIASMTGGLAHEIKNPLSTIGLNTRLLSEMLEDIDVPEDQKGRLTRRAEALGREVARLEGILTDFLEYAGDPRLDILPTDLNELVQEVTDFFAPQAEQRGVRLHVQLSPAPTTATVDAGQLKQSILNLMLNAVQAAESGGASSTGGACELIVRTACEDGGCAIHVTDTGPGMDAATLARVFEPYFTTKAGGSGLGLPITRKLIEAMGGRFALHSEPGKGTDVRLWFPHLTEPTMTDSTPT